MHAILTRQGLSAIVMFVACSHANAATFDLDLTADGDSRWFELFSGAFAQIDAPFSGNPALDGAFSVADETNQLLSGATQLNVGNEAAFDAFSPVNFVQFGSGVDYFPSEGDFGVVGSVEYDDATGAITGMTLDLDDHVAFTNTIVAAMVGDGYETVLSNIAGTVSTIAGIPSRIDATADVLFSYGGSALQYNGVLRISGNRFDLFVDEAPQTAFGPVRLSWDIEGQIAHLVPEPSSCLLLGLACIAPLVNWRRSHQALLEKRSSVPQSVVSVRLKRRVPICLAIVAAGDSKF